MSSRKSALIEAQSSKTPTRYAPSTPHAIRALQQRSAARTRSVRQQRTLTDTVQPDSARGILRQLARLTAPASKRLVATPTGLLAQENEKPREEDEARFKRPRLTLDIDESLDDIGARGIEEEEDSELPAAPTPSVLPDDNDTHSTNEQDDPTFTLKSINYTTQGQNPEDSRSRSRRPISTFEPGDAETSLLSEVGRRAPTADPTEAFSYYDLGEFNLDAFVSRQPSKSPARSQSELEDLEQDGYTPVDDGGETEVLRRLEQPQSVVPADESKFDISTLDDPNFQYSDPDFEVNAHQTLAATTPRVAEASVLQPQVDTARYDSVSDDQVAVGFETRSNAEPGYRSDSEAEHLNVSNATSSNPSEATTKPRRKKLKLTRHGELVPSLPSSLIRRVALQAQARLGNRRPKLGKDHMKALEQATEWYFEQVGEDLAAYSSHARRKRVDLSDAHLLLHRQRVLQGDGELLKAAKEFLPKEVVADLHLEDAHT